MSLRDRQIGGVPLEKGSAFALEAVGTLLVVLFAYKLWAPFFGFPEELRWFFACVGVAFYLYNTTGRVPPGIERAQLFFGTYTGISFPAGVYVLPKLPFPIISLLLEVVFKEEVSKYLGWTLEGDVSVESIVVPLSAEGLTNDGVRVSLDGQLVFEVVHVAIYLSQRADSTNKVSLEKALEAEVASQLKQRVIAVSTAKELYRGVYPGGLTLNDLISEVCNFAQGFGLRLARSPIVTVNIESERIRKAFDVDGSQALLEKTAMALATRFRKYKAELGSGVSEEVALMLFNADQIDNGQPTLDMNLVKFK
jgi:hypothetical protein